MTMMTSERAALRRCGWRQQRPLNVNVIDRSTLLEAMAHPARYPNLTVRISGYAVRFNALRPELQEEIVARTFHERV